MNSTLTMLVSVIAASLTACSTQQPQVWADALPNVRAQMGTVGVRADSTISRDFVFEEPDSKGRSTRDMAGFGIHANLESVAGAERAAPFVLMLMPAFALGGAIYGSVAGVPAAKLIQAVAAVTNASAECDLTRWLPECIVSRARSSGFEVMDASGGRANYDAELTVRVVTQQLTRAGNESPNPALLLHYLVEARLTDAKGDLLYSTYCETKSRRWKFVEWAEDEARRLRKEAACQRDEIAAKLVRRVFLGDDSE